MSANNWVCFDCRIALREAKTAPHVPKCPDCGADCHCLGYKVEIPKKANTRGWRKLRLDCRKRQLAWNDRQAVNRVRQVHAAERRIAYLRSLGPNRDREKLIAELAETIRG